MEYSLTLAIIIACSIIHSIFGVGLLVFGTPIFLLLGFSYADTLWIVLPPSLAINAFQVLEHRRLITNSKDYLFWYALPTLLSTIAALTVFTELNLRVFVGTLLVLNGILRIPSRMQKGVRTFFERHLKLVTLAIGAVHGLTNMGGGLLTTLMGSIHQTKESFRANVAFAYLIMATIKIGTLVTLSIIPEKPELIPSFVLTAVGTYLAMGNLIYRRFNNVAFNHAITLLILSFGVLLFV